MPKSVSLQVNGVAHQVTVENRDLLVQTLRDGCRLTGTHVGCDTSTCGACVVLIDGQAVKSCTTLTVQNEGRNITTVEGLAAEDGSLNPLQEGFKQMHGLQCGYCTPGMMVTATDLLARNPDPTETEIRDALEGNICRCTGYHNIVRAIQYAAKKMSGAELPQEELTV